MAITRGGNVFEDSANGDYSYGARGNGTSATGVIIIDAMSELALTAGTRTVQLDVGGERAWGTMLATSGASVIAGGTAGLLDRVDIRIGYDGGNGILDLQDASASFVAVEGVNATIGTDRGSGVVQVRNSRLAIEASQGPATMAIGGVDGFGRVDVFDGGSFDLIAADGTASLNIGTAEEALGNLIVDDEGSSVNVIGTINLGRVILEEYDTGPFGPRYYESYLSGNGNVFVGDGSTLSARSVALNNGSIALSGGTIVLGEDAAGGTLGISGGFFVVNAGATSTVQGDIDFGAAPSVGERYFPSQLIFNVDSNGTAGELVVEGTVNFEDTSVLVSTDHFLSEGDRFDFLSAEGLNVAEARFHVNGPDASEVSGLGFSFSVSVPRGEQRIVFEALSDYVSETRADFSFDPSSSDGIDLTLTHAYSASWYGTGAGYAFIDISNVTNLATTNTDDSVDLSAAFGIDRVEVDLRAGDDTVVVDGSENAVVNGGAGTDTVRIDSLAGSSTYVVLDSAAGRSNLFGFENVVTGAGADTVTGNAAGNLFVDASGSDAYRGEGGIDTVDYASATQVSADLSAGTASTSPTEIDTLSSIENLIGSGGDDTLVGSSTGNMLSGGNGVDRLEGRGGNDVLRGGAGSDELFGGDQNDVLFGGTGADLLNGGRGFDYVSYTDSTSGIVLDVRAPGQNAGDAAGDVLQLIENLVGSNHADTIGGGNVANELLGRAGDDVIDGRGGADLIDGGAGADLLTGGQGFDTFRYRLTGESRRDAADTITDFERGRDAIDLVAIDADTSSVGDDAFTFVGTAAFTGTAGELRYVTGTGNSVVAADVDGDARPDLIIKLTGVSELSGDDFLL